MGFLKGLATMMATKYGMVSGGKYRGAYLALGSDTDKKVSVGDMPNQLLFVKGTKELGRVSMKEVARYEVLTETRAAATLKLIWTSGEESIVNIQRVNREGKTLISTAAGSNLGYLETLFALLANK